MDCPSPFESQQSCPRHESSVSSGQMSLMPLFWSTSTVQGLCRSTSCSPQRKASVLTQQRVRSHTQAQPAGAKSNPLAVQASKIGSLRAKAYQGSDQEWAHIISSILGQPVTTAEAALLEGIEATASVTGSDEEGKELVITIRKRVQSITVCSSCPPGNMATQNLAHSVTAKTRCY